MENNWGTTFVKDLDQFNVTNLTSKAFPNDLRVPLESDFSNSKPKNVEYMDRSGGKVTMIMLS